MIERLDGTDVQLAQRIYQKVFRGTTILDAPFQPQIQRRMLFWPDDRYLTAAQGRGARAGHRRRLGLRRQLLVQLARRGRVRRLGSVGPHRRRAGICGRGLALRALARARHRGASGDWGALLPESGDAVSGGPPEVVKRFARLAGIDEDEDVREAIAYWTETGRQDFQASWLAQRLRHLYGADRAAELLAGSDFEEPTP